MNTMLAAALVMGVAGSAHCLGMCGPIALAVPAPHSGWRSRFVSTALLNGGRLFTYALIGAAFGTFGLGLRLAGLQQTLSVAVGAVLLISVFLPGFLTRWSPQGWMATRIGRLRSALAKSLKRTAPEALFTTGALNGLLPCGLVYAAAIGASTTGSMEQGALFMVLFGLGTVPALMALRMSGDLLASGLRERLRRAAPVLVSVVAVLMILRGLDLGIHMISPEAPRTPATVTSCY